MNSDLLQRVQGRWDSLTKPPGSLGRLEETVLQLAEIQGREVPVTERRGMYIFCADHGVTEERISAYPSAVTREMMRNFSRGGAAINVLCRREGIRAIVVDTGVAGQPVPGVLDRRAGEGTCNFAQRPAMTREQANRCIENGRQLAREAAREFDIVGLGEMGIGNTTSAAALLSVFSREDPALTAGAGAGADSDQLLRKSEVIRRGLALHRPDPSDAIGVLASVGGFEIATITGFLLQANDGGLAVVLDGFPCCSAALAAQSIDPLSVRNLFYAHRSAERGHELMLRILGAKPLLSLGMRLGEGTGAALAIGIIDAAVRLYREMATFSEAAVSGPARNTP